ncbi:MAG TPA: o-succinylbenzoate--CoA ligase [Solirubrobacterales bacterium]|nr:o-succinylbenzoate--CoA ligase [Solirubrobacterales bacterium]
MRIDDWLAQRAQSCPERTALIAEGAEVTYAELEAEATWVARRLAAHGVRRGSTAALTMHPRREQVVLAHALMKVGAALLPLSPRLTEAEHARIVETVEPMIDLDDPGLLTQTEADLPMLGEHDTDDVCAYVLTSGSSGTPKPIGLTYGNFLWSAMGGAFNIGVDPADRWLCCVPLSHIAGLSIVVRSAIYGTTAVVHDGFDVDRVAAALREEPITVVSLVTTMLKRLLDADADLSGPRAILVGGGPVPASMLGEAIERGATVVQTYGLTETCSQVTTLAPEDALRKLGSAGRPLLSSHVRIRDGEILVQGPTVAPGRYDESGWLHTGDLGHIDDEGFLYVQDRIDDMIVTGGENVVPSEVEEVLLTHPAVVEAAVVGREDPEWQQAVTAVVVLAPDAEVTTDELRHHCAATLAGYKVPKRVELAAALPRTPSGKLMRRALR